MTAGLVAFGSAPLSRTLHAPRPALIAAAPPAESLRELAPDTLSPLDQLESAAPLSPEAADAGPAAAPERRADNDLGGRITLGLGWTPRAPEVNQDHSAFARTAAADSGAAPKPST